MEVLLDSSFIISCIRKRIDFLEELKKMGLVPIVPREVMEELKDLKMRDGNSREDREAVEIALKMIEFQGIKKMKLGNKKTDLGLIEKGKEGVYIATLDREIKRNVPNRIVISSASNGLLIERD